MISFIVPAHNEERWIAQCLTSIRTSMESIDEPYEVIVVDDASTDATLRIAKRMGARTIRVEHRKVSAFRNAGAGVACGTMLFFVDADTRIRPQAVSAGLEILRSDASGGGCVFEFDEPIPLWGRVVHRLGVTVGRLLAPWVAGSALKLLLQVLDLSSFHRLPRIAPDTPTPSP